MDAGHPSDPPPMGPDAACAIYETADAGGGGHFPMNWSVAPATQANSAVGCTTLGVAAHPAACCARFRCNVKNQCVPVVEGELGLPRFLCEQDCYPPPPPPPPTYSCHSPADGKCTLHTDGYGKFNSSVECTADPTCAAPPAPPPPGGWRPDWMTFYEMDVGTNGSGIANFSNLVWCASSGLPSFCCRKFSFCI